MRYRVAFSPDARIDLQDLYRYIAEHSGADRALGYIERIEKTCANLGEFPERGSPRDYVRPGLRVLGFERRAVIAFSIEKDRVTILRILYGGREFESNG